MGNFMKWCRGDEPPQVEEPPKKVSKITEADVVKSNLKKTRDYIQGFIDRKDKERTELNEEIMRRYQKNKSKKELVPFLQTKKELNDFIESAESKIKMIQRSISDVEMQQTNMETMKVLQESNKFKQKIQDELEDMNWRGILEQAQEKYESPLVQLEEEDDEEFQALWKQLGGDKMDAVEKVEVPTVSVPKVIEIAEIKKTEDQEEKEVAYA